MAMRLRIDCSKVAAFHAQPVFWMFVGPGHASVRDIVTSILSRVPSSESRLSADDTCLYLDDAAVPLSEPAVILRDGDAVQLRQVQEPDGDAVYIHPPAHLRSSSVKDSTRSVSGAVAGTKRPRDSSNGQVATVKKTRRGCRGGRKHKSKGTSGLAAGSNNVNTSRCTNGDDDSSSDSDSTSPSSTSSDDDKEIKGKTTTTDFVILSGTWCPLLLQEDNALSRLYPGAMVRFKTLELSEKMTPEVSDWRFGRIITASKDTLQVNVIEPPLDRSGIAVRTSEVLDVDTTTIVECEVLQASTSFPSSPPNACTNTNSNTGSLRDPADIIYNPTSPPMEPADATTLGATLPAVSQLEPPAAATAPPDPAGATRSLSDRRATSRLRKQSVGAFLRRIGAT